MSNIIIRCEECGFGTSGNDFKRLQHLLTDKEGALVSDGEGGYYSICPNCKEDTLALEID